MGGFDVYTSLNKPSHYVVTNRILDKAKALRDADIEQYTRLLIDLDPVRSESPAVMRNSTEQGKRHGVSQSDEGIWLSRTGMGLLGQRHSSHLPSEDTQGRCVLPTVEANPQGLSNLVRVEGVDLDTSVGNPAQLCRAYGTINLKGAETPQRPFRQSEVWVPSRYRCVPRSALRAFSEACIQSITVDSTSHSSSPNRVRRDASKPRGTGDYTTLDAVSWFKWMGLYRFPCNPDKHAIVCPWSAEHTGGGKQDAATSTVLFTDSNYPVFHCKHNSCEDRRLFDVIDSLEGADAFCARDWGANT